VSEQNDNNVYYLSCLNYPISLGQLDRQMCTFHCLRTESFT